MTKCKFIDKCTHATGWCNSERIWKTCEYIFDVCKVTDLLCAYCNPVCEHRKERKDDYMEEKKLNPTYTCPYCREMHNTPEAMAECILACKKKKDAEEEKAKWEKMQKEKENRKNQIIAKRKELADLEHDFYEDYRDYPASNTITIKPISLDKEDFDKYFKDVFDRIRYIKI